MTSKLARLWFQLFFIFTPKIGEDEPILMSIFFRWVGSTTNQLDFMSYEWYVWKSLSWDDLKMLSLGVMVWHSNSCPIQWGLSHHYLNFVSWKTIYIDMWHDMISFIHYLNDICHSSRFCKLKDAVCFYVFTLLESSIALGTWWLEGQLSFWEGLFSGVLVLGNAI